MTTFFQYDQSFKFVINIGISSLSTRRIICLFLFICVIFHRTSIKVVGDKSYSDDDALKLLSKIDPIVNTTSQHSFLYRNADFDGQYLKYILSHYRCLFNRNMTKASTALKAQFSHIPKAGGTTVREFYRRYNRATFEWCHIMAHSGFVERERVCSSKEPHSIFLTLNREPTSLAISLFTYIRGCSNMGNHNPLWTIGFQHKKNFSNWINHPLVQLNLANKSLAVIGAPREIVRKIDFIPAMKEISTSRFLESTARAPPERQCKDHLLAALLLLKRYSIIGSLDRLDIFWKLFLHRLNMKPSLYSAAMNTHANKRVSRGSDVFHIPDEVKMKLYCERLLFEIGRAIAVRDMECEGLRITGRLGN